MRLTFKQNNYWLHIINIIITLNIINSITVLCLYYFLNDNLYCQLLYKLKYTILFKNVLKKKLYKFCFYDRVSKYVLIVIIMTVSR